MAAVMAETRKGGKGMDLHDYKDVAENYDRYLEAMYTQQTYGNWKFETLDDNGNVIDERIRPLLMRQTNRSEIFLLAELCGFDQEISEVSLVFIAEGK